MGYFGQTIKGLSWVSALRGVTRGLSFARIAVLARLLTPAQFGLFGIASLVLSLVEVFTETGVNIFLVQEKDKIDKYINSAWIVSIIRGLIIALVIIFSTPLMASFFNAPQSLNLLLLISIVPILRGFINPSLVLFQKDLTFHKEFYFRSIILFIETIVTISLGLVFRSPFVLVWGLIVSAAVEVILSFVMISPRPRFIFEKRYVTDVVHSGKWVTMSTIFSYLYQNVDDMVIGKILNISQLGLYQMAYRIAMLPITEVADVIARVTFPVYAKISGDVDRLKKAFLKTTGMTVLFSIPIILLFLFFPSQIVAIILGDKWMAVVPAFQVLVFFGLARAITSPALILLLSVKRQDIVAKISFFTFLILAITIVPFVMKWGIVGAGISSALASVIILPFAYYKAWRLFDVKEETV